MAGMLAAAASSWLITSLQNLVDFIEITGAEACQVTLPLTSTGGIGAWEITNEALFGFGQASAPWWQAGVNLAGVGDVRRFPSLSHFSAANGTAPSPAESGPVQRHRLNRGGNRRLNRAPDTIALIQARVDPRAGAYIDRRRSEAKSRRESIRCLKRHLSNVVYRPMLADVDDCLSTHD